MSFLKRLHNALPDQTKGTQPPGYLTVSQDPPPVFLPNSFNVGNPVKLYPEDNGDRYVRYGYNFNDAVNAIVGTNAEKAGQLRLYLNRVKKDERKTLKEYKELRKGPMSEKVVKEMNRMRKAMMEEMVTDSPLSKLLAKPNRNQTQSEFIEQLYGFHVLQGEGNIWLNAPNDKVLELFIIPKPNLLVVGNGRDPWQIVRFALLMNGHEIETKAEDIIMWRNATYRFDPLTLAHLRGMSMLEAGMPLLQGLNEGNQMVVNMNHNVGAAGLAWQEDEATRKPTLQQSQEIRRQFNQAVNSSDMAGKIAILSGKWGYQQFSRTLQEMQIVEQYNLGFKRLCRLFRTPHVIFDGETTFNNQASAERKWIYSTISPKLNAVCTLLTDKLIPRFGLSPEEYFIGYDPLTLPELATDMKERVEALKGAIGLTVDQRLEEMGYEPIGGEMGAAVLIPTGYQNLKDITSDTGRDLDNEMNLLNDTDE